MSWALTLAKELAMGPGATGTARGVGAAITAPDTTPMRRSPPMSMLWAAMRVGVVADPGVVASGELDVTLLAAAATLAAASRGRVEKLSWGVDKGTARWPGWAGRARDGATGVGWGAPRRRAATGTGWRARIRPGRQGA